MSIEQVQIGTGPSDEIRRRRALAAALMKQGQTTAQVPAEWSSMRVTPRLSVGQGLASMGQQLLGAYEARKADDAEAAYRQQLQNGNESLVNALTRDPAPRYLNADGTPGREANTQLLDPTTGRPELSDKGKLLGAALANYDPAQARDVLAAAVMQRAIPPTESEYTLKPGEARFKGGARVAALPADAPKPAEAPATVREYEYAKGQGFKGSLQDWIAASRPPMQPTPAQLVTRPGDGGTNQDFAFDPRARTLTKVGDPYTKPTALSPKDTQTARNKLVTLNLAEKQLADAEAAFAKLKGTFSAGLGGGLLPTEEGRSFDAAVNRMRDTFTGLTRTPGVGSMSDFETRLAMSKFPERGEYESVTAEQLAGLRQLVNALKSGYSDMLGPDTTSPGANNAQAAGPSPSNPARPSGAPPEAVQFLRSNPQLREQFRVKYGYVPEGL